MIIVRIIGGHSNQLFQYAVGRALASKRNTELKLDITTYFDNQPAENTPREYELAVYPLRASIASPSEIKNALDGQSENNRYKKFLMNKDRFVIYNEKPTSFQSEVLRLPKNAYLIGYWQNENHFKDIRKDLIKEFEPVKPMSLKNKQYLARIQSTQAISLHIRREDYVDNKSANEFHGLMPLDYYKAALAIILKKTKDNNRHVFVFSKEIDWCKKNIKLDLPTTFIEGNKDGSDDMRLMKHCKHNIMANSSFSWWGAWLNQNPDKIIVAPKIWFQDPSANKNMELPKSWIRL